MFNSKTKVRSLGEANKILSFIQDPLSRYYNGIVFGGLLGNVRMIRNYSYKFIKTLISVPFITFLDNPFSERGSVEPSRYVAIFKKIWEKSDSISWILKELSLQRFEELFVSYVEFKKQLTQDSMKALIQGIDFLISSNTISDETKNKFLPILYIDLLSSLIEEEQVNDSYVEQAYKFNKSYKKSGTMRKLIKEYCEKRFELLKSPKNSSHIKNSEKMISLFTLVCPKELDKIKPYIIASDLVVSNWSHRLSDDFRFTKNDSIADYAETAYGFIESIHSNGGEWKSLVYWFVEKLDEHDFNFRKPSLKIHCEALLYEKFSEPISPTSDLESIKRTLKYVSVDKFDKVGRIRYVTRALIDGHIEFADVLRKLFAVEFDQEMLDVVKTQLETKLITPTSSLSRSTGVFESFSSMPSMDSEIKGDLIQALLLQQRIDAVQDYFDKGLPNVEDIPVSDLRGGYMGKILLLDFQGKIFLRINDGREDMHRDIHKKFDQELKQMGFLGYAEVKGGAHIRLESDRQNSQKKFWLIDGHSEDYGECDKKVAKELVQGQFPGMEVVTR